MKKVKPTAVQVKVELNEVSHLVGELLTLADASFPDRIQRESFKTLIKQIVWNWGTDWHFAATEEQIKEMEKNSENCENPQEEQVKHFGA